MIEKKPQAPVGRITREDISREIPDVGETEIIMQRHEQYIRDPEHEHSGSLAPEDAQKAFDQTVDILTEKLSSIPEMERKNVVILVIASNTNYGKAKGMRSFETATQVVNGIQEVLKNFGLDIKQLLNSRTSVSEIAGRVIP